MKKTKHKRGWTLAENDTLRANYRTLGPVGVADLLPGRSKNAIRKQACALGVSDPEQSTAPNMDPHWPLPACDLLESLANVRLRKWAPQVKPSPRFGVAMIGGRA